MSMIMTLWLKGDPEGLEKYASENPDEMRSIADRAKQHGLIAHRFYGADGQIMVIDEWPDEQSFRSFFESARERIQQLMEAAGAASEPGITFWRKLETHDEVGWES